MSASSAFAPVYPPLLPLRFSAYGGIVIAFVETLHPVGWRASLSADAAEWVSLVAGETGIGSDTVTLQADPNTGPALRGTLTVSFTSGPRPPLVWPLEQISAVPLATLNAAVLEVPWPNVPRVMELGIAGKFIAQQVAKIPEPFTLLALLVVELIVVALGLLLVTARALLAPLVPEPKTWFGVPPGGYAEPFAPLTEIQPATAVCIIEETALLAIYIAEETLSGGQ